MRCRWKWPGRIVIITGQEATRLCKQGAHRVEIELLAIFFGVERFRKYTDEGEVFVDSDHKAFEDNMWKTPNLSP